MALTQFADGVWTATDPVRIVGMQLSTTMTVLRLARGELMLHSPIDVELVAGFRLNELALLYRPERVLVVADLVHNVGRPNGVWAKFYTKTMGFYDRVALSRVIRWTAFANPRAARESLDRLLAWDFERVIVGHGAPVPANAKDLLASALA